MIEKGPIVLHRETTDKSWLEAIKLLLTKKEMFNLIVRIDRPISMRCKLDGIYEEYDAFCKQNKILSLHDVIYTIFPYTLYLKNCKRNEKQLYKAYTRGIYPKIKTSWGTYFHRLVNWEYSQKENINQLGDVIKKLKEYKTIYKSAFPMTIVTPCNNLGRPIGAPCLNYLTLQIEPEDRSVSLLAVYRNHYFLDKALGNYIGLSYLLEFICRHSGYKVGALTCISSHAELKSTKKQNLYFEKLIKKYE